LSIKNYQLSIINYQLKNMIPSSFEYTRAESVPEAIKMLRANPNAKILAGGHSLIPAMKLRMNSPSMLIDIARIPELNFIRDRGKYIAIGAATTHATIASHKTVLKKIPLFAVVAELIGDVQVRNKGTIGGSIAHADPAADWPAALMAAHATVVVDGAFGERKIPATDFFKGFFWTELGEGEIITEIHVPEPDAATLFVAYEKFMQPASRFAIAACAVQLKVEDNVIVSASVAFNGVSNCAYKATAVENALINKAPTGEVFAAAAAHAAENAELIMADHYGQEDYRTHLAKVVCRRALNNAVSLG
jgi:aerobic carbon-monoxide dehydrogenase medium subunit